MFTILITDNMLCMMLLLLMITIIIIAYDIIIVTGADAENVCLTITLNLFTNSIICNVM